MALGVHLHSLTRTMVNHFTTFIARLKAPAQTGLRKKFEEFVDDCQDAPLANLSP
jgi:hypothetical protein